MVQQIENRFPFLLAQEKGVFLADSFDLAQWGSEGEAQ